MGSIQKVDEDVQACRYAMELASASVPVMVLKTAIELDILEIIKKSGPGAKISVGEIVSQIQNLKNPDAPVMLDRMLRLLASYNILTCTLKDEEKDDGKVERLYGLAPVCKFLTKNEAGCSMSALLLMNQDKVLMESCQNLSLSDQKRSIIPGIQHISGDMFARVPNADTIFMKWIM